MVRADREVKKGRKRIFKKITMEKKSVIKPVYPTVLCSWGS